MAMAVATLARMARDCSRWPASVSTRCDARDGNATYPIAEAIVVGSSVSDTATA